MEEKIFFNNARGERLCGLLSLVGEDKVTILCHGHSSSKNNKTYDAMVPILNDARVSTFRFDFYGNGESECKFEESNLSDSIDATTGAIKLVKEKGFKKIILVGSSFGGLSSTMTASQSKDLYALVLKSPVSDYGEVHFERYGKEGMEEWKQKGQALYDPKQHKRGLVLNYSFVEDYQGYDAYAAAQTILIPTLILHGTQDQIVPFSQSQKLSTLIPNVTFRAVEGADHSYTQEDKFQQMVQLIADFIIKEISSYLSP